MVTVKVKNTSYKFSGTSTEKGGVKMLNIHGSIFYPSRFDGGRLTTYDSTSFANAIGKKQPKNMHMVVENYQEIIEYLYPERKKVTFVKKYEDFIVHNTGETLVRGEVWINGVGEEKKFETLRKEF